MIDESKGIGIGIDTMGYSEPPDEPESDEEEPVNVCPQWSLGEKFEELLQRGSGYRIRNGHSHEISHVDLGRAELDDGTFCVDLLVGIEAGLDPLKETLEALRRIVNAAERAGVIR